MLISLILLFIITLGGAALTYLFVRDEPLLWRLAAGTVIGSAIFGTAGFLIAMGLGLSGVTVVAATALTLAPTLLLVDRERRKLFEHDWAKAKGKLQGANRSKVLRFLYYAAFLLLFVFFFDRAMIETADGIFTAGRIISATCRFISERSSALRAEQISRRRIRAFRAPGFLTPSSRTSLRPVS